MRLEVRGLHFSYTPEREVLKDISFDVERGDIFCVLGPNGCGKTTLLKCLGGILKPNKGSILLDGVEASTISRAEYAKLVGYVPQEHGLVFPYKTIDVVLMGRAPHLGIFSTPSEKDYRIAEEALREVGIYHLKDRPYVELSGGARQLVIIARVLAQQPKILLLDEPTSHLDIKNQMAILRIVTKLAEQGMTIVMSTHFPRHALLFSSKVGIMVGGRFIAIGNPEEVVTEERLKKAYDIDIKILTVKNPLGDRAIKVCIPVEALSGRQLVGGAWSRV